MVTVIIESELVHTEKDFPQMLRLSEFKEKLYRITGIEPSDMDLVVKRQYDNKEICHVKKEESDADCDFLASAETLVVVATDTNAHSVTNQLAEQADGPTPAQGISEEDYLQRDQSVLRWKMAHGYGRFDVAQQSQRAAQTLQDEAYAREQLTAAIGLACRVTSDGRAPREAVLRYVGPLPSGATGTWCGVEFAEASGKNAGCFQGVTLFGPVAPGHGLFVRPRAVEILAENEGAVHRDEESDGEI
ncbi:hypothetical protein SEUBUCD646_0N01750 [Saccharomyces eubayanus]|uniref:CAP-Gly domain-containing protein n=1 Tax=Saccharomyces eubayanus TaxID=1080349 RepID=A0ABN8VM88_SACEU|nr:ALF1-like protein [Saccharomyces eubayanus]KOG97016.1 ALF1-like protein [Saccharomyces eubayanus]CAI1678737.1 hypothetical protein SEUBUCD650_0N01750 [Saccharomyces eubayanus]CAI1710067.1 hypothetical protein SEUBUCD646_0N01750 [Saccharomyces eubayanus]